MSKEIEERTRYLNSLSERDLFVEHILMSLDESVKELKFIKFLAEKDKDAVLGELDRLHTTLATTRYMVEYHRPW
jgi:uncharacterized protein (UPF0305 family)